MLIVRCRVWAVVIPNIANKGVSCVSGGQERRCCGAPQIGPPLESTRTVARVGGTVGRGVAVTLQFQVSVARNENGSSEQPVWVVSDVHEYMNGDHGVLLALLKQNWWMCPETRADNSTSLIAGGLRGVVVTAIRFSRSRMNQSHNSCFQRRFGRA
jgi:hypothetical protein